MKLKVYVEKKDDGKYIVTEWHFDRNGTTVYHRCHGSDFTRSEAYGKKHSIIEAYS